MVGTKPENERATRDFLATFAALAPDDGVAELAVRLRRSQRIELPDEVIWATAQLHSLLPVTRNTKDFPADDPGIRSPYVL